MTYAKDAYLWCVGQIEAHPHLTFWAAAGIAVVLAVLL